MKLSDRELSFVARLAYSAQRIADNPRPETKAWDELSDSVQMVHEETVRQIEENRHDELMDMRFSGYAATGRVFVEVVEQALAGRKKFVRQVIEEVRPEIERTLEARIAALEARS